MKATLFYSLFFSFLLHPSLWAQTSIKGNIYDRQSDQPLIGANVVLQVAADSVRGTVSDLDGRFVIEAVPPGRFELKISYLGYNTTTIPNILVTSGKDVILEAGLEESAVEMSEIVVRAETEKDKANNELATVSARMFTLEEVTRYSGGRNDASRMAANFAGVQIADDSRNDIVIRGNSPIGVLWRLEGIPIPNPNHFATLGTTGGPVSALNTNLLRNSDFLTSAFPAEYGNANAGVFDIQFRSGNRDKYEFTAQLAAFSGLEFMAEGPLNRKNKGSFLVSYRHSFVELAHVIGLDFGTAALPKYKDLSFKLDLGRTKSGKWTIFGIGGLSDIDFLAKDLTEDDFWAEQNQNSYASSKIGVVGINHKYLLSDRSYIRTTLAITSSGNNFTVEEVLPDEATDLFFTGDDEESRMTFSSFVNKKVSAKFTYRAGVLIEHFFIDAFLREKINQNWVSYRDFDDGIDLVQSYAQAQYRAGEKITINGGLHTQYLGFNQKFAVEPRAAVNWHLSRKQTINMGFGSHRQILPLPLYLMTLSTPGGEMVRTNTDVDFLKSRHFVLGYDHRLDRDWRLKSEVYLQQHVDVPVESLSSSFSVLNVGADFGFPEVHYLQNSGEGKNYGIELTLEKFFANNYYGLATGSLYQSKYKGSDGIERNTAFNNKYVLNILGGKEFLFGRNKGNAFTVDFKFTTAGGRYFTPIDLAKSIESGKEIKLDELAYSERFDPYVRLDLKLGYRLNPKNKRRSEQFFLDFQNITNHQNVFIRRYNESTQKINTIYQIGFFPDILYRLQF